MQIVGIGCDLLKRSRILLLLSRSAKQAESAAGREKGKSDRLWRFSRRILSPLEQKEFDNLLVVGKDTTNRTSMDTRLTDFLAVRWAAKEACYKAFYPNEKLTWKNITITKGVKSGRM